MVDFNPWDEPTPTDDSANAPVRQEQIRQVQTANVATATTATIKEISPAKSYTIGTLIKGATPRDPKFRKHFTTHGSELKANGIKNIVHFTENKRLGLVPTQTYYVYEVDDTDAGNLIYWGQFTAQQPPAPKVKKLSGLGAVQQNPATPAPDITYAIPSGMGVNSQGQNAIEPNSRTVWAMRESYDKMLAEKQAQLDYNNKVRDAELVNIKAAHREEIDRLIDTKQSEILTLENISEKIEIKHDKLLGEYYTLQNENAALRSQLAIKEGELKSQADDNLKRQKTLADEYKTREDLYGQELRLKHAQQAGLGDNSNTVSGILDVVKTLQPLISMWMNSNSTPQPTATTNGATAQAPPPRPLRPSLPPLPSNGQPAPENTGEVHSA